MLVVQWAAGPTPIDLNVLLRKCNTQRSHQVFIDRFRSPIKALAKIGLIGGGEGECSKKLKTSDASQVSGGSLMRAKKQIVTSGHPLADYLSKTSEKSEAAGRISFENIMQLVAWNPD